MIKVSIVTPTYNNKNKLAKNLNSVRNQNFKNIEHIIIDNLSTDGTEEIVKDYILKAGHPVIYIREKDNGIYNGMNKGIKIASGEWIHILNSDDYYYSNNSVETLFKNSIDEFDAVACTILIQNGLTGEIIEEWIPEYNDKINHYNFPHPGMLIRKDFYNRVGLYDERFKILADAVFCMKYLPVAKYKIFKEPLVVMLDSGVSNKFSFRRFYELILFNFFIYKGPFKVRVKYTFLNIKRDAKVIINNIRKKT